MKNILLFLFCFPLSIMYAQPKFTVADVFTDNMVLQRDAKVRIWGKATNGEKIQLLFNGQHKQCLSLNGQWEITLDPMAYGGPYEMKIRLDGDTVTFKNVLVGDVWLAGGQSNMEWTMRRVKDATSQIADADYPEIRYYKAPRVFYSSHQVPKGDWRVCSSVTVPEFSAIAYYFARNVYKEIGVPIGIIQCPVGGTTIEAWMSRETLLADKRHKPIIENYDSIVSSYGTRYEALYTEWENNKAIYDQATKEQQRKLKNPVEPMGERNFRRPTGVYENMLRPLMPYTLKGFIFYQGESNTGRGEQYQTLFPAMIKEWRKGWRQGDIPFLFIQLPKFNTKSREWAELRDAQYLTAQKVKNCGMVVAYDQGDPRNIHPWVKDTVGWRLSSLALGQVYKRRKVYSGPELKKYSVKNDEVILTFLHVGSGLVAKDGEKEIKGFTMAGKDERFYPAKALIVNENTIKLTVEEVDKPLYVRYAWANSIEINLFNKEVFPAVPFRTDKLELVSKGIWK